MTQVHAVLWEAKRAAGMAVAGKPTRPTPANVGPHKGNPGFLGRWREIRNEDNPERHTTEIMVAVIRAKVESQAARTDSPKHRAGGHANSKAICGDTYWAANLDAGLAYLQPSAPRLEAVEDRGPEMKPLPEDVEGAIAASKRVQEQLKAAAREHRRGRA